MRIRRYLLRIAVLAALVGFVAWRLDFHALAGYLTIDMLIAALAVQPIVLAGFAITGLRLAALVDKPAAPFAAAFKAQLLSRGCNVFIPGHAAEVLKATYLRDHAAVPLSAGLSGMLLERMMDLLMVGLLAILAISLTLSDVSATFFAVVTLVVAVALVVMSRMRSQLVGLARRIPWAVARQFLENCLTHAATRLDAPTTALTLFYSFALWVIALANVTLFLGMVESIPIGVSGAIVVFVASTLGAAVPALPAGLGTYEAAVVFALKGFGYSLEEAVAIALALHASQIVLSVAGATVIVMTERIGLASLATQVMGILRSQKDA